uniref:Uncharacterized protein n=3 Tax=Lotharella globosa TaxID=91324 RepID=A0A7S3YKQ8_9EUKA
MFFFVVNEYFPKMGYLTWLHYYTIFTNMYIFGAFFATMALQVIHRKNGGETELAWRERSWKRNASLVSEHQKGVLDDAKSQGTPRDFHPKALEDTPMLGNSSRRDSWQCFPSLYRQPDQYYSQHLNDLIAAGFVVGYIMFNTFMFGIEYHRWANFDMMNPICDEDHWN